MVEALLVIDEKRRGALLLERRQAGELAALTAQRNGPSDKVGQADARFYLVQESVRKGHDST